MIHRARIVTLVTALTLTLGALASSQRVMAFFSATDETLNWTADKLKDIGVQHLMAGHCTGVEPMFRLRAGLNLDRKTAVIGPVGSRFVLGEGIYPTAIAQ